MFDFASLLFVAAFRDWVIIVTGIIIGAFFLVALVLTLVLGLLARAAQEVAARQGVVAAR